MTWCKLQVGTSAKCKNKIETYFCWLFGIKILLSPYHNQNEIELKCSSIAASVLMVCYKCGFWETHKLEQVAKEHDLQKHLEWENGSCDIWSVWTGEFRCFHVFVRAEARLGDISQHPSLQQFVFINHLAVCWP